MRSGLSLILCLTFLVLCLPKNLWHSCEEVHAADYDHSAETSFHKKCFACDWDCTPSATAQATFRPLFDKVSVAPDSQVCSALLASQEAQVALRGPPFAFKVFSLF